MTIELSPDTEAQIQDLIKTGKYESIKAFIEEAISNAYSETEIFAEMVRAKLQKSQNAFDSGHVFTLPEGGVTELLRQYRDGALTFKQ
jgi:Arc/MetJ-type ribon-helix-helix transcriptional regulator